MDFKTRSAHIPIQIGATVKEFLGSLTLFKKTDLKKKKPFRGGGAEGECLQYLSQGMHLKREQTKQISNFREWV